MQNSAMRSREVAVAMYARDLYINLEQIARSVAELITVSLDEKCEFRELSTSVCALGEMVNHQAGILASVLEILQLAGHARSSLMPCSA